MSELKKPQTTVTNLKKINTTLQVKLPRDLKIINGYDRGE